MNRILITGYFYLFGMITLFASENQKDLINRLNNYQEKTYRLSVENLQKKYLAEYQTIDGWEDALKELTENRIELVEGLKTNDKNTQKKVQKILRVLDSNLLANPLLKETNIIAIRRSLSENARTAMKRDLGIATANFRNNSEIQNPATGWNNTFVRIKSILSQLQLDTLYAPQQGMIITDPELSFDATRLLYSSIGTNGRWHLFELDLQTQQTRQITPESYKDFDSFDGCYTPDGRLVFCSTATFLGLPCTNGENKMCGLFIYDPKTNQTRQLTFDQDSNWGPVILNNGQILYQRWEYADLPHANSRIMFTMNPDGTSQQAYYGSNSYFPTAFFNARPIPEHQTAMVGIVSGHHSLSRSGRLMVIDPAKGRHEADGVVAEIPHYGEKVRPLVRDRLSDGVWPQFLQPYPLNKDYFIVSMKATPTSLWGLYLVDTYNNMTLIMEEEGAAYLEPVVEVKRVVPPVIPDRVNLKSKTSTVFLQDIYIGDGLKDIPRGTVKRLRIGSYNFSPWNQGGLLGTIGMDGPWDIKRILGTVDVEEDGSAMFTIPANTPIFLQPLDEEGKALQVMRSWFTGMPGETVSCIGCHESKNLIPVPKRSIASQKKPQNINEWYGKERGFSYRHEVQPVLDKFCVSCHDGKYTDRPYLKGDRWISDWSSQISGCASSDYGGHFTESYANLHRYVRRPGIESDMHMLVPMDVHADQTELMQMLQKGHYNVKLDSMAVEKLACWIDFNAPFHGRRNDIPNYPRTEKSNDLRELYHELLGAPSIKGHERLPEIDTTQQFIVPQKNELGTGDSILQGWPYYNPLKQPVVAWQKTYQVQMNIGGHYQMTNFQKSIYLTDDIVLELVKIPAGKFIMGSTRQLDEMPLQVVDIKKPYWIGRFEITNKQFRLFDPSHDSRDEHRHGYQFGRKGYSLNHEDQPAVRLSWRQAMDFCKWLSEKTGMQFSLPTEAQWEWACRAGSDTPFWYGDLHTDFSRFANLGDIRLKEFASCSSHKNYESVRVIDNPNRYDDWIPHDTIYSDGGFISEPIGQYIANPWDLHDMHGNVWEWTRSSYLPYPYVNDDGRNDPNPNQTKRVARGGSWYDRPFRSTSSFRLPYRDYQKVYNVGFRVIMVEE